MKLLLGFEYVVLVQLLVISRIGWRRNNLKCGNKVTLIAEPTRTVKHQVSFFKKINFFASN